MILAAAAVLALSVVPPECEYEDGSEMLYSKRYSLCVWSIDRSHDYLVSIDRRTETKRGAYLTYTYRTGLTITHVERDWVEK